MKKRLILTLAVLISAVTASAYDILIDNIYYNIVSKADRTVEVTYKKDLYTYRGDVVIPSTIKYNDMELTVVAVGNSAFCKSINMTSVVLPSTITRIEKYAFASCANLKSIEIPYNVTYIGKEAFSHCPIQKIHIPENVDSIGELAFFKSSLEEIEIPNNVKYIGEQAFSTCKKLKKVVWPKSIDTIPNSAFYDCEYLETIEIPENVKAIGSYAFKANWQLTSIVLPSGLKSLGVEAFAGCDKITEIISLNPTPPTAGTDALRNISDTKCTIKVPVGSVPAYQRAAGWKEFWHIVEITDEEYNALGIVDASIEEVTRGKTFNLNGQNVGGGYKGIVVQKGKKLLKR